MIEAAYDYAKKNLNTFDITDTYFGGFNFGGSFEERAADLEKFYNYLVNVADPTGSYLSDLQNDVLEQWEVAVENAELLKSLTADTSQTLNPINPSTTHNSAEYYEELGKTALAESEARLAALQDIYEKSEEEFQKKRDDLDYQYSMGLISAEEYYSQLSNMKSQYLQPDSDEWRSVSVELKKYYDSLTAEQQKAIDEAERLARLHITRRNRSCSSVSRPTRSPRSSIIPSLRRYVTNISTKTAPSGAALISRRISKCA